MEWKKNINTNLGITIILMFAAIFTIVDFYVVCSHIDGYPFNDISGNTVNSGVDTVAEDKEVVEEKNVDVVNENVAGDNNEKKYDNFRDFSCIEKNENYCLFKNDDILKVEIEANSVLDYTVIINGNRFSPQFDYYSYLDDIQVLSDGYIYVQYGVQGLGPVEKAFILDSNANIITKTTDIDYTIDGIDHADIKFVDNKLSLTNIKFGDGGLGVICENAPDANDIVYTFYQYEYIGSGKLNEVSHMSKNFSEYLQTYTGYSNCEDYLNR